MRANAKKHPAAHLQRKKNRARRAAATAPRLDSTARLRYSFTRVSIYARGGLRSFMEGTPLKDKYSCYFAEMAALSRAADKIDETNVRQEANPGTRAIMDRMVEENLRAGSRLAGREHFKEFYELVKSGKRGLILMEHYSNIDLPTLCYLLDHDSEEFGRELDRRIVAIAGMKLNEENPMVKAWAEGFSRVVIYPSRSLAKYDDPAEHEREEAKSRKINMAAMRAMDKAKKQGRVILVFPSGTRYRPGRPETKKGLREIDSYLRMFDVMLLVSINGCCLRINPADPENMIADLVVPDTVIVTASPVIYCKTFRDEIISGISDPSADPKQATVDRVMEILEQQHEQCERTRLNT